MDDSQYWSLANLGGARGDTNNMRPGFVGRFDAGSFDARSARASQTASTVEGLFNGQPETGDRRVVQSAERSAQAPESWSEASARAALDAARQNGRPILSVSVGPDGLSAADQQTLEAVRNDFNVVRIDTAQAEQMMRQGLHPDDFWALANLRGANGDLNNIRPGYMGVFTPSDINAATRSTTVQAGCSSRGCGSCFSSCSTATRSSFRASASGAQNQDLATFLTSNRLVAAERLTPAEVRPPSPPSDGDTRPAPPTPRAVQPGFGTIALALRRTKQRLNRSRKYSRSCSVLGNQSAAKALLASLYSRKVLIPLSTTHW
ncbi:MAG: hypothetical protein K2Z81_09210, partial [Cyanobacteria bacterium]|nr:hypothetical protein [Cyanobacteriota bacterium]